MPPLRRLPGSYLVLETINQCSLACVHCTVAEGAAHPHHAAVGFMAPALFQAILDDLAAAGLGFDTLIPFWLGEPLLHPQFGALYQAGLRAAAEFGTFRRVELHTNATHLGRDRVRVALNAAPVPQTWHLSIDAATPERYRAIKGKASFDEVEANILAFLDERARTRAPWPRPVFQMIVGENNADEVPAFAERWTARCRERGLAVRTAAQAVPEGNDAVVFFRQLDAPTVALQERANAAYRRAMASIGVGLPKPAATPVAVAGGAGAGAAAADVGAGRGGGLHLRELAGDQGLVRRAEIGRHRRPLDQRALRAVLLLPLLAGLLGLGLVGVRV